jgi:ribose 5-phosphate isomerase RpiB
MKIYIAGDSAELAITAANIINNSGNSAIISEARKSDYRDLLAEVEARVKNYDMALFFSKKPFDACADINKIDGARAVVCDNSGAVKRIMDGGKFNVMVIDATLVAKRDLLTILAELVEIRKWMPEESEEQEVPVKQQKKRGIMEGLHMMTEKAKPKERPKKLEGRDSEDGTYLDGENFVDKAKKKGLLKAMKDELGIE